MSVYTVDDVYALLQTVEGVVNTVDTSVTTIDGIVDKIYFIVHALFPILCSSGLFELKDKTIDNYPSEIKEALNEVKKRILDLESENNTLASKRIRVIEQKFAEEEQAKFFKKISSKNNTKITKR